MFTWNSLVTQKIRIKTFCTCLKYLKAFLMFTGKNSKKYIKIDQSQNVNVPYRTNLGQVE